MQNEHTHKPNLSAAECKGIGKNAVNFGQKYLALQSIGGFAETGQNFWGDKMETFWH